MDVVEIADVASEGKVRSGGGVVVVVGNVVDVVVVVGNVVNVVVVVGIEHVRI